MSGQLIEEIAVKYFGKQMTVVAFFLVSALAPTLVTSAHAEVAPSLYPVPEFNLTDQNNKSVNLKTLQGKVWFADFIYTTCTDECPLMTSKMLKLQHALHGTANVMFVSITTDPKRDTSAKLKTYAEGFHADQGNWLFLTGTKKSIVELSVKGFKLPADEKSVSHTSKFGLVDQRGNVRGYFDSNSDTDLQRAVETAKSIVSEGKS